MKDKVTTEHTESTEPRPKLSDRGKGAVERLAHRRELLEPRAAVGAREQRAVAAAARALKLARMSG